MEQTILYGTYEHVKMNPTIMNNYDAQIKMLINK